MSTAEIKYQIISTIHEIDDVSILDKVKKYLKSIQKSYTRTEVIGYDSATKQPLTSEQAEERIINAINSVNKGDFFTTEQVENEAKNW